MSKIFLLGGTGLIGKALQTHLVSLGYEITVYVRRNKKISLENQKNKMVQISEYSGPIEPSTFKNFDIVINLAGANIFDKRWTPARKQEILDSRVGFTKQIVDALNKLPREQRPKQLINASAIGFYGTAWTKTFDETSSQGDDFLARLCTEWEKEAVKFSGETSIARFGIVLSQSGGMLGKLIPLYRLFLGGKLDSGKQWISWIHINDAIKAIAFLIGKQSGAYNIVAPHCVRQEIFAEKLAKTLHRRNFLTTPELMLRLSLGERSRYLVSGQKVIPKRLLEEKFEFDFPLLDQTLRDLVL